MEAPTNANRITRDPEDPEGEGDTQYYTLPVHSESQTVASFKITETHVHKMNALFVPYSLIGTSHGCFRLNSNIFGLYAKRIQQPLPVFAMQAAP